MKKIKDIELTKDDVIDDGIYHYIQDRKGQWHRPYKKEKFPHNHFDNCIIVDTDEENDGGILYYVEYKNEKRA